ncbi:DUF3971 domain-containing protein [Pseudomonas aeruginosa]
MFIEGFRSPRAGLQRESAEFPGQRRQGRHTSRPAGTDAAPDVDGTVDSNLKDGIKLLQEAPIPTRKIFAGWEGDGPLQGHLKLDIPLDHDEAGKTGVVVDFSTVGATLKMPSPKLDMSEVKGRLPFRPGQGPERPGGAGPGAGRRGTPADRRRGARRCAHALAAPAAGWRSSR